MRTTDTNACTCPLTVGPYKNEKTRTSQLNMNPKTTITLLIFWSFFLIDCFPDIKETCDSNEECIDGYLCDKENHCVKVEQEQLQIRVESLPNGILNEKYSYTISVQGGLKPYFLRIETALSWLSYDKQSDDGTFELTGVPDDKVTGVAVELIVNDSTVGDGQTISKNLMLNVVYCSVGQNDACSGHGTCSDDALCTCNPGYAGKQCERCAEGYQLNDQQECVRYEYQCAGDGCGANAQRRACAGEDCQGVEWEMLEDCPDSAVCWADQQGAGCTECGEHGCTDGKCSSCVEGPCCENGQIRPSEYVCDRWTEYRCSGVLCGDDVDKQVYVKRCTGKTAECDGGTEVEITWTTTEDCHDNQICISDGTTSAECETCNYGCNQNVCLVEDPTVEVSAGWWHACGLKGDGTVYCWGDNQYGQATPPDDNTGFTQVSTGLYHTCGVKGNDTVHCWGLNDDDQATPPDDNSGFTQVSAGYRYTCGLKGNGMVCCWGDNEYGQATPPDDNTDFTQVSAGKYHTCGLKGNGTVHCWGYNLFGQATPPDDNSGFTQVSAGSYHNCGLKGDGRVHCWRSYNDYGQATPPDDNTDFTQVGAGVYHNCGVKGKGTVHCWGLNDFDQATPPDDNTNFTQVSAGKYHTCGLKGDGTVHCWGNNEKGQLDLP